VCKRGLAQETEAGGVVDVAEWTGTGYSFFRIARRQTQVHLKNHGKIPHV